MICETIKIGSNATLKTYLWDESKELGVLARPAVLVIPGGGYMMCSDREAEPVALAYAAEGFQAFVLRYSVNAGFEAPFKEAQEAVRIIRENSKKWNIAENALAACGFSAGGHLACSLGTLAKEKVNALVLGYPALVGKDWEKAGQNIPDLICKVGKDTPPSFVFACTDDPTVPIGNAIAYISKLDEYGIPFECHIYGNGGHGFSVAKKLSASGDSNMINPHAGAWVSDSVAWLKSMLGDLKMVQKPILTEPIPPVLSVPFGKLMADERTKSILLKYSEAFLAPQLLQFGKDAPLKAFITEIGLSSEEIYALANELEKT